MECPVDRNGPRTGNPMLCRKEVANTLLLGSHSIQGLRRAPHLSQGFPFILLSSWPSTLAQLNLGVLVFPGMGFSLQYGLEPQTSSAWVRGHNLYVYLDLCVPPEPPDTGQHVRDGSWTRSHSSYLATTCRDTPMGFYRAQSRAARSM